MNYFAREDYRRWQAGRDTLAPRVVLLGWSITGTLAAFGDILHIRADKAHVPSFARVGQHVRVTVEVLGV